MTVGIVSPRRSWWLLAAAAAIIAAPLVLPGLGGAFKGSDDLGTEAINAARPGYQPWVKPLWTPPSDEVESLLFSLQAALGAGVLGYMIGRRHASKHDDVAGR
jgi:cobalt/nickel transport protein